MRYQIQHNSAPGDAEIDPLVKGINEDAFEQAGLGPTVPSGYFAYDDEGNMIAGVFVVDVWGVVLVDSIWVHKEHRRQGYGRALMEKVEGFARERECSAIMLLTMNWDEAAIALYTKLGFKPVHREEGFKKKGASLYFRKEL